MHALNRAAVAVGSFLLLTPVAMAQQPNQSGFGGALDTLNRAVNPESQRDERPTREDERSRRDQQVDPSRGSERGVSGSSAREKGNAPSYRAYSDRDLSDEAARLQDQERQIRRERQAVDEELERRRTRR
jgi:hypothetical protein